MERTVSFALPKSLNSMLGPELASDDFELYLAEKGVQDLLVRVLEKLSRERPSEPVQSIIEFLQEAYPDGSGAMRSEIESKLLDFDEVDVPQSPVFFESPNKRTPLRLRRDLDESMISEPDITVDNLLPRPPMLFANDEELRSMKRSSFCAVNEEFDAVSLGLTEPRSEKDRAFLRQTLPKLWVTSQLNVEELERLMDAFEHVEYPKDSLVDSGTCMYILQSGSCVVMDQGEPANDLVPGESFGAAALLLGETAECTERVLVQSERAALFRIPSSVFRATVSKGVAERRQRHVALLSRVSLLVGLDEKKLLALADVLQTRTYAPGQTVVVQGDRGSEFFVIEKGVAEVVHDDESVGKLHAGEYFGEIALLDSSGKRAATVRVPAEACEPLEVACLRRQVFNRLLGAHVLGEMRKMVPLYKRTPKRSLAKVFA
jgi:hypothetical protein